MAGMLRYLGWLVVLAVVGPAVGQEKVDHESLSRVIRDLVLKKAPRYVEDLSGWGKSVPPPPRLRLPNVPRTTIKVGDRVELAHGPWKRIRVWMEDPQRDLVLNVTELRPLEGSLYRLSLSALAPVQGEGEFVQWLNGLRIVGVTARASAVVQADFAFDVNLALNVAKFPPEVTVEPKVVGSRLEIKEFELFKPQEARNPQRAEELNRDLKGLLQNLLTSHEPRLRDEVNRTIAQAIREGRGTFSAAALYKALGK